MRRRAVDVVLVSHERLDLLRGGRQQPHVLGLRICTLVEHIVPINRGQTTSNMLSINRGQPPEGGGFGGFVANMLITI